MDSPCWQVLTHPNIFHSKSSNCEQYETWKENGWKYLGFTHGCKSVRFLAITVILAVAGFQELSDIDFKRATYALLGLSGVSLVV